MNQVVLNIRGSQTLGDRQEKIEMTTQGTLERQENGVILTYEDAESDAFDCETAICVDGDVVSMKKKGGFETHFIFETSKTYSTIYTTPFGEMNITIFPTLVDSNIEDDKGRIDLEYVLSIGDAQMVNRLNLHYETKNPRQ